MLLLFIVLASINVEDLCCQYYQIIIQLKKTNIAAIYIIEMKQIIILFICLKLICSIYNVELSSKRTQLNSGNNLYRNDPDMHEPMGRDLQSNSNQFTQLQLKVDHTQTVQISQTKQTHLLLNLIDFSQNSLQFSGLYFKRIVGNVKTLKIQVYCGERQASFQMQIKEFYYLSQIINGCQQKQGQTAQQFKQSNLKIKIKIKTISQTQIYQVTLISLHSHLKVSNHSARTFSQYTLYFKRDQIEEQLKPQDFRYSFPTKYIQISLTHKLSSANLKFQRLRGYAKLYFYQCDEQKLQACRQQIQSQYIQGSVLLRHIQTIKLSSDQQNCPKCIWIIGIKQITQITQINLFIHLNMNPTQNNEIEAKKIPSKNLQKNKPLMGKLDNKQQYQMYHLFLVPDSSSYSKDQNIMDQLCVDITLLNFILNGKYKDQQIVQQLQLFKHASHKFAQSISISIITNDTAHQAKDSFQITFFNRMIRIIAKQKIQFQFNDKLEFLITVKLPTVLKEVFYLITDHNLNFNILDMPDGLELPIYLFKQKDSYSQYKFTVNSNHFGIVLVTALNCSDFNQLQIILTDLNSLNQHKIQPKVFLSNMQHHTFCNQLIEIHPSINTKQTQQTFIDIKLIFGNTENERQETTSQFYLMFNSIQIINLSQYLVFSNVVQYGSNNFYLVQQIQGWAIIKISKCSECQLAVLYSEEQFYQVSSFQKRSAEVHQQDIETLTQFISYQMKHGSTLYIKITTNNFAYYNIEVGNNYKAYGSKQLQKIDHKNIQFSLNDDGILQLQIPDPKFMETSLTDSFQETKQSHLEFFLIQGSMKNQVARETYCPKNIFTQNERTRDVAITQIKPNIREGHSKIYEFNLTLKHHDYFGIRVNTKDRYYSYKIVDLSGMKQFGKYRWAIFHSALFLTMSIFFSFVCFLALKKKTFKGKGYLSQDIQNEQKQNLRQSQ